MKSFELFKLTEEISKEFMLDSVLWTLVVTLMKICRKRSNMIKEKIFVERKGTRKYNGTKSKDNRIKKWNKGNSGLRQWWFVPLTLALQRERQAGPGSSL